MRAEMSSPSLVPSAEQILEASIDQSGNLVIPAAELPLNAGSQIMLVVAEPESAVSRPASARRLEPSLAVAITAGALVLGAIVVIAIHGRQWHWTGFSGNTSLWSWLTMLTQPIALAWLTIRLLSSDRALRAWRMVAISACVLLALVIAGSYGWNWGWTGFRGEALWDWLHLMLLPIILVLLPEWVRKGQPFRRQHGIGAALLLGGFALLILGGYSWGWTWTGFTGNSFYDWLVLMIAPFLLPASCKVLHAYHSARRGSTTANSGHVLMISPAGATARRG